MDLSTPKHDNSSFIDALSALAERGRRRLRRLTSVVVPKRFHPHIFRLYLRAVRPLYAGTQVECPCCERSFRGFIPYATRWSSKESHICPGCGSFDRHRLLWMYLTEMTNILSDHLRVLHIAPEDCLQRILRSRTNLDYLSADLNSSLAMERMDITDIAYPDCSFDVVLCNHVLEEVDNDQHALREFFRILRPGGWALVQSPIDNQRATTFEDPAITTPEDREKIYWYEHNVRLYGRDYQQRLENAGFQVKVDPYARTLPEVLIQLRGLSDEDIYFCRKP